jgi:hypothetical protein
MIIYLIGDSHENLTTFMSYSMDKDSESVSIVVGNFDRDYRDGVLWCEQRICSFW